MFNPPNDIFSNWNKTCYIRPILKPIEDAYGNELNQYGESSKYSFNYQPVANKDEAEMQKFGQSSNGIVRAMLDTYKYQGRIKEFDLAYLYGATPEDEAYNGENANYKVVTCVPQNTKILVYFEKIVKEQGGN